MVDNRLKFLLYLFIFLIVAAGIFALTNSKKESVPLGKIEVIPKEYDAGLVSMSKGVVKYTYQIKNSGEGDLKIFGISTSCACTTARLKVNGKTSPEFGMHDNPSFWSEKIEPGKAGDLEVTFDPAAHGPTGVGKVIRAIYLKTNDPKNKEVEILFLAEVTP